MKISVEVTEKELRELVLGYMESKLGNVMLDEKKVLIQVKSKQNYKSEWEEAAFRATYQAEG